MRRISSAVLATGVLFGSVLVLGRWASAESGPDPKAIIAKAAKALGGADKLAAVKAMSWKTKGKLSFNGADGDFNAAFTAQGIDHFSQKFEGDFGGNQVKGVIILAGDKGWRQFGEDGGKLEDEQLANTKRTVYLQLVPATIVALEGKGFKVAPAAEAKVDGKPAVAIKATGPDGKDFELYFDKESGLPVKQVATVAGFQGDEFKQETTYTNYKDFDGIKRATKIDVKRNGEKFIEQEVTEFKLLDKVDPKTFAEP